MEIQVGQAINNVAEVQALRDLQWQDNMSKPAAVLRAAGLPRGVSLYYGCVFV